MYVIYRGLVPDAGIFRIMGMARLLMASIAVGNIDCREEYHSILLRKSYMTGLLNWENIIRLLSRDKVLYNCKEVLKVH